MHGTKAILTCKEKHISPFQNNIITPQFGRLQCVDGNWNRGLFACTPGQLINFSNIDTAPNYIYNHKPNIYIFPIITTDDKQVLEWIRYLIQTQGPSSITTDDKRVREWLKFLTQKQTQDNNIARRQYNYLKGNRFPNRNPSSQIYFPE